MTGTSMACPHVSGLAAYLIGKSGNITPAQMKQKVKDMSIKNILKDIRECNSNSPACELKCCANDLAFTAAGTVNALARNDV